MNLSKPQINRISFQGDDAVEIVTPSFRLVAVVSRGPRIAFFSKPGTENLLLWTPGKYKRGNWDLMGGHRHWLARPGADEAEETYAADNQPCTLEIEADGVVITGAADPLLKVVRGMAIRVVGNDRLEIDHFSKNVGEMLFSCHPWALTCSIPTPTTSYVIPLGDDSSWDTATVVSFKTWGGGHKGGYNDDQFSFTDDALIVRSAGRENKRMIRADLGIIALRDPKRDVLFAKRAVYQPDGAYPLNTNIAVYTGPESFMVEMETMGPAHALKPGQSAHYVETWLLRPLTAEADQMRTLFG